MLAQSVRPLHLRTPDDHALALNPSGRGRVSIARRLGSGAWCEASVPVSDLPYAARQLQSEHNVCLTQNRFFSRRRLVAHLAELDTLSTDLDYYKTLLADAVRAAIVADEKKRRAADKRGEARCPSGG